MGVTSSLGSLDRLDTWGLDHRLGISSQGRKDFSEQMMIEPIQLFKWFPPASCVTPTMHRLMFVPYVILASVFLVLAYWAIDRVQPIKIVSQDVIPSGRPGEQILVRAKVERDLDPPCSVDVSRVIITQDGFRFTPEQFTFTPEALAESTRRDPASMRVAIQIPIGAPKGPATVYTTLIYHCNPLDRIWPIRTTTVLHFEIL